MRTKYQRERDRQTVRQSEEEKARERREGLKPRDVREMKQRYIRGSSCVHFTTVPD